MVSKKLRKIFLTSLLLCLVLGAGKVFAQCGSDGRQPCKPKPKPMIESPLKVKPKSVPKPFGVAKSKPISIDVKAVYNRAVKHSENEEYDAAIRDYSTVINISPTFRDAYYNRGSAYLNKGNYAAAIRDFTKDIELNPQEAAGYNSRAIAYEAIGRKDLADADRKMFAELINQ